MNLLSSIKVLLFTVFIIDLLRDFIEQGMDVKTVSHLLGHTDVKITLNRYVHSTADTKKAAIHKLQKSLSAL